MRFVLLTSCALALTASAAAAETSDPWKVDVVRYGTRQGTDLSHTVFEYGTMDIGTLRFAPSFRKQEWKDEHDLIPVPDEGIELGLSAYLKDHPRVLFIGRYLYRRARKNDANDVPFVNRLPDVLGAPHGAGVRIGFRWTF